MNIEIEKEITNCVATLRDGGYIIFPSEIGWSIACIADVAENINAIYTSEKHNNHAILIETSGRLNKFIKEISESIYDLIEFSNKPLHLSSNNILNYPAENYKSFESIFFRVVKDEFTRTILSKISKPLFAATFIDASHPAKVNSILNKKCYVVNLRVSSKATIDNLVKMRIDDGTKFEILKN